MLKSNTVLQHNANCMFQVNSLFALNKAKIFTLLTRGRIVVLRTIYSTNQYIIDNLKYMQSGDVFVTDHQTHGRGRYGKLWITPNSQGIALSMYWRINQKLLMKSELSVIISFVIAKVLKKFGVSQVKIKWPNDLYVYNRKLAGILIEIITKSHLDSHIIIGIGINMSICTCTKSVMSFNNNWIDLKKIGICLDYNILVVSLVKELRLAMKQFEYNKYMLFTTYYSKKLDYLYNQSIALLINNRISHGVVIGIHENGMLLVLDKSGITHQYLKDNISILKM